MRIGLISDTHNEQSRLRRALEYLRLESVDTVLHAGDVATSQVLRLLDGFDTWVARGNMDRDPMLFQVSQELFGPGRYRSSHTLYLDGINLALIHSVDSDTARVWMASDSFDYVIHGHTHRPRDERIGHTRIINPGALSMPRGSSEPSFAVLDLATGDLQYIKV